MTQGGTWTDPSGAMSGGPVSGGPVSGGSVPAAGPLLPGDPRRLGPYRVLGRLGEGGMGTVFLGDRPPPGAGIPGAPSGSGAPFAPVAIKIIRAEYARDEQYRERFRREAEAARRVARFCTAQVLDVVLGDDLTYLVTEFIDGPTLAAWVMQEGPLPGSLLDSLATGVAAALNGIHAAGIVHRDLKPGNVLLSRLGPKVIDFGIARTTDHALTRTDSGPVIGTPAYMAPEQFDGRITAASDVFAWGCVITYAATGRTPFGSGTPYALMRRVTTDEPDLTGLEPQLRDLVGRALRKRPEQRPTARELLLALVGDQGDPVLASTRILDAAAWALPDPHGEPPHDPPPAGPGALDLPSAGVDAPGLPSPGVGAPNSSPAGAGAPEPSPAGAGAPDPSSAGAGAPDLPPTRVDRPGHPSARASRPDLPPTRVEDRPRRRVRLVWLVGAALAALLAVGTAIVLLPGLGGHDPGAARSGNVPAGAPAGTANAAGSGPARAPTGTGPATPTGVGPATPTGAGPGTPTGAGPATPSGAGDRPAGGTEAPAGSGITLDTRVPATGTAVLRVGEVHRHRLALTAGGPVYLQGVADDCGSHLIPWTLARADGSTVAAADLTCGRYGPLQLAAGEYELRLGGPGIEGRYAVRLVRA